MSSLQGFAYLQILEMLEGGLMQGHEDDGWKKETQEFHLLKAEGHINQYRKCRAGMIQSDEMHLRNALTRLAMALYMEKGDEV